MIHHMNSALKIHRRNWPSGGTGWRTVGKLGKGGGGVAGEGWSSFLSVHDRVESEEAANDGDHVLLGHDGQSVGVGFQVVRDHAAQDRRAGVGDAARVGKLAGHALGEGTAKVTGDKDREAGEGTSWVGRAAATSALFVARHETRRICSPNALGFQLDSKVVHPLRESGEAFVDPLVQVIDRDDNVVDSIRQPAAEGVDALVEAAETEVTIRGKLLEVGVEAKDCDGQRPCLPCLVNGAYRRLPDRSCS